MVRTRSESRRLHSKTPEGNALPDSAASTTSTATSPDASASTAPPNRQQPLRRTVPQPFALSQPSQRAQRPSTTTSSTSSTSASPRPPTSRELWFPKPPASTASTAKAAQASRSLAQFPASSATLAPAATTATQQATQSLSRSSVTTATPASSAPQAPAQFSNSLFRLTPNGASSCTDSSPSTRSLLSSRCPPTPGSPMNNQAPPGGASQANAAELLRLDLALTTIEAAAAPASRTNDVILAMGQAQACLADAGIKAEMTQAFNAPRWREWRHRAPQMSQRATPRRSLHQGPGLDPRELCHEEPDAADYRHRHFGSVCSAGDLACARPSAQYVAFC